MPFRFHFLPEKRMIFLDTTYLLGIQLSDRMLLDVEERRQGILYMRNDLLHEILGDDDEDPGTSSLRSTCWMI